MSNQYGDFIISKTIVDGQCAGQKTQMLRVSYENTYIIELKSHIWINKKYNNNNINTQ